jgi:AmmeMemoRadiSam system protein B
MPHREEHSIEFQLIFLQHLLRQRSSFTFVPILCSFSYQLFEYENFSEDRKLVQDFSDALRKTIEQYDGRVCFIASVDFSHVGPRYGDDIVPDESFLKQVSAVDHELIKSLEQVDSNAFHAAIRKVDDCYRVCGYSSLITMLNSIQAEKGELLDYANTCVDEQSSTVTFASMALY